MLINQLTFSFFLIGFLLSVGLLYLYFKNNCDKKFIYASLFFLSATGYLLSNYFMQLNLNNRAIFFWNKLMFAAIFTLIYTFPHFMYNMFGRKYSYTFSRVTGIIVLGLIILIFSTDLFIQNRTIDFRGALRAAKTELLYFTVFITIIFLGYIFFELMEKIRNSKENLINTRPMIAGVIFALIIGAFDIVETLLNKTLIFNIHDPFIIGLFIIIVTFAWSFLFQYSMVFASLSKSKEEIERLIAKSNKNFIEFVQLIAKTLDAKDEYTAGHSLRVQDYAVKIARALNLPESDIELLKQACLLHDIGKIGIPDGILNKKTPLNEKEKRYIMNHPILGKKILETVSEFQSILDIVYTHHERVDSKGYPEGLDKDKIPLLARIIAVADTFDAMISERPYRKAKSKKEAIIELLSVKDTQLDGKIVDVFINLLNET